ncbi:MAG TPA: thiamine phosphate synthase [Thermodesulfovibrionales bacterium]|nr:thiamine phosphate synthase [Thermodesulfovibrionales bacterium]
MKRRSGLKEVSPFLGGVCLVTDRKLCGLTCEEMARIALETGVGWIQYREKEKTRREIYHEAKRLRRLTAEYGATLVVNDHVDIALAVEADGVHLGQDDLPLKEARRILGDRIIGISTHSLTQAADAEHDGADYVGFGPVFFTTTKDAGEAKGLEMVSVIRRAVRIPVVAIGGISAENLSLVMEAGADAVAVASAVLKGDISENVRSFMRILRDG